MRILHNGMQYMLCSGVTYTMFNHFVNNGQMTALYVNDTYTGACNSAEFGRAWRVYQCEN